MEGNKRCVLDHDRSLVAHSAHKAWWKINLIYFQCYLNLVSELCQENKRNCKVIISHTHSISFEIWVVL